MTSTSRYEKISLCTKKLAMKKSRYEQISPWRNLAMQLCYRFNLSTYALYLRASPLRQFVFAIFLLIRVSQYPFAPCVSTYMFNKASVNVSCFGIPDLQLPRHAIEPELCPPPLRSSPTGRAWRGGQTPLGIICFTTYLGDLVPQSQ